MLVVGVGLGGRGWGAYSYSPVCDFCGAEFRFVFALVFMFIA